VATRLTRSIPTNNNPVTNLCLHEAPISETVSICLYRGQRLR
jgi:hypothetical protein